MGQRPWTADQTVLNGWRLPACLPSHRLSSPYNDAARPKRLGAVLATSDRPAIAMCICTAALSPVLRASTTKKNNISCEQHIFFS